MRAERDDVLRDVLVSLVAAVSLLKRGSKKAAPSDRMFDQMMADYERSIERAKSFLNGSPEPQQPAADKTT